MKNELSKTDIDDAFSKYKQKLVVVFKKLKNEFAISENIDYISETNIIGMVDFLFAQNEEKYLRDILTVFANEIRQKIDYIN